MCQPVTMDRFMDARKAQTFLRIALLFVSVLSGCAELPEYARPQFFSGADGSGYDQTSFGYRQLEIADFQADSLPASYSEFNHRIQARSCISFKPSDDTVIHIARGNVAGQQLYLGSFTTFAFQAVFNPACSWWSPDVPKHVESYVLQHEQIHFALAELAARKLNRESQQKVTEHLSFGETPADVQAELVDLAQRISREAVEVEIKNHTRFDEETSLVYDPIAQQRWYDDVSSLLKENVLQ